MTRDPRPAEWAVLAWVPIAAAACLETGDAVGPRPRAEPVFVDVAAEAGLGFEHRNGASGRFYLPETMAPGAAFLDFDNDSLLDVYLIQSGPLPPVPESADHDRAGNRLFRNRGHGRFEEATSSAGAGDPGYGSGVAVADYDGDGWVDIYATYLGANRLYHNEGDGTFTDVTSRAGVGDPGYSTSAAFFDYDGDLDLDLFVCNYVVWSPQLERPCLAPNGQRGYCRPGAFRPQPDTLYRNEGNGAFTDVSAAAGIHRAAGNGLGLVTADFDGDRRIDVFVANDQMPNHLWINRGDGTFSEEALLRGCALNELGQPEAGMGVTTGDPDDDGDWDLFVVHLSGETNTFYRNQNGLFRDVTDELGLGAVSQPFTGFGTALFDFDNDGSLDLFLANGKVNPGASLDLDFREPNQLLRGLADGSFEEVSGSAGSALGLAEVSRGAAFGDYDNDGDVDILVANNDGPVRLLRNQGGHRRNHWLIVELLGTPRFDRDAIGAEVILELAGGRRRRQVQPAYSYCASSDPRAHFGLGSASVVERLTVIWPDGTRSEREQVGADQILTLRWGGL